MANNKSNADNKSFCDNRSSRLRSELVDASLNRGMRSNSKSNQNRRRMKSTTSEDKERSRGRAHRSSSRRSTRRRSSSRRSSRWSGSAERSTNTRRSAEEGRAEHRRKTTTDEEGIAIEIVDVKDNYEPEHNSKKRKEKQRDIKITLKLVKYIDVYVNPNN